MGRFFEGVHNRSNLIPGYPLDGGGVFRAAVWAVTHDLQRATLIASSVDRGFGFPFIMVGVWQMLGGDLIGGAVSNLKCNRG